MAGRRCDFISNWHRAGKTINLKSADNQIETAKIKEISK